MRVTATAVRIEAAGAVLEADLAMPDTPRGVVLFAHGSGSSRYSPRNRMVAGRLRESGFGTVLVDLLTVGEERVDERTARLRFDIGLLAGRLVGVVDWLDRKAALSPLPVGLFGASTGAAAALVAATRRSEGVRAVVSRGGRPDLAGAALAGVKVPTLLIVGGRDHPVVELNEAAAQTLAGPCELRLVPDATHLFPEPGALEQVAELAIDWFGRHLAPADGWPTRGPGGRGTGS